MKPTPLACTPNSLIRFAHSAQVFGSALAFHREQSGFYQKKACTELLWTWNPHPQPNHSIFSSAWWHYTDIHRDNQSFKVVRPQRFPIIQFNQ